MTIPRPPPPSVTSAKASQIEQRRAGLSLLAPLRTMPFRAQTCRSIPGGDKKTQSYLSFTLLPHLVALTKFEVACGPAAGCAHGCAKASDR